MGIRAVIRKKRPYYGKEGALCHFGQSSKQGFHASKPNEKWVTDITYLMFQRAKAYICPPLKTYTIMKSLPTILVRRNDIKLVIDTLKKAIKKRNVKGVLLHSDQGFQYTSRQYNNYLKDTI